MTRGLLGFSHGR